MHPRRLLLTGVLAGVLVLPGAAFAQVPGYKGGDARQLLAEYRAEILGQLNQAMETWGRAWSEDDVEGLVDLYAEDATVFVHGKDPIRGQDAIRAHFGETLPTLGAADAFLLDFDASGGMAMAHSNYTIEVQSGPGRGTRLAGPMITVYVQRGRAWRIRSQAFLGR